MTDSNEPTPEPAGRAKEPLAGTPERTISVETSQGTLVVRRVSLGALARIAQRMSVSATRDEVALLDALVREVVGERRRIEGQSHEPTHTLAAERFAKLGDDDHRSIAAAVLTLEGIKAAGEGLVEDPRDVLVQRYAPMLDTDPVALAALGALAPGAILAATATDAARAGGQIPLFDAPVPTLPRRRADDPPAPDAPRADSAARAAARAQRTRLEDTVQRQGALIERQAMEREAAHAEVTQLALRVDEARTETRLYRRLALGAAGIGLAVALALAGYALSLRGDLKAQRAAHEAQLAEQQRAFERAAATRTPPAAGASDQGGKRRARSTGR